MNIKRCIYFSPLGYFISLIQNLVAVFHRPFMVYGYNNRVKKSWMRSVRISSTVTIIDKEKCDISDNVWVWHHTILDASNHIKIGEGCQIGAWVGIFSHSSHVAVRLHGRGYINVDRDLRLGYVRAPVEIGEYSFIGAGACVLPGVIIGKGSLIAAGAVVSKSVPPFSIAAGNPAKVIGSTLDMDKKYFDDPVVQKSYFDQSAIKEYLDSKRVALYE